MLEKYPLPGVETVAHNLSIETERVTTALSYFKRDKTVVGLIYNLLNTRELSAAILDYGFLGQYIDIFREAGVPVIYSTHNAQSFLTAQTPRHGIGSLLKRSNAWLQAIHERHYFNRCDKLVVVSEEDRRFHNRIVAPEKVCLIPNFVDETDYAISSDKGDYIIISGNFEAFQNAEGLRWFILNVWNERGLENVPLYLAGVHSDKVLRELNIDIPEGIHALGVVDDLRSLIARARVALVPVVHGSGTRLKIIEAMALKTAIVTTSKGIEGMDCNGAAIVADDPKEFRERTLDIFKNDAMNQRLAESAYEVFLKNYSMRANSKKLKQCIQEILFR